jgi:hypothetical protein
MTVSIKVSVNGNYKLPVSWKQGGNESAQIISGRGHEGPKELYVHFTHGADAMTLVVGPEEPDND